MEEIFGDGGVATPVPLSVSGSFREGRGSSRRRGSARQPSMEADEFMNLLHGSDPVKVELNRLENEVRGVEMEMKMLLDLKVLDLDFFVNFLKFNLIFELVFSFVVDKDRELSEAQAEIKALRHSERLREKAVEEVTSNFSIVIFGVIVGFIVLFKFVSMGYSFAYYVMLLYSLLVIASLHVGLGLGGIK